MYYSVDKKDINLYNNGELETKKLPELYLYQRKILLI